MGQLTTDLDLTPARIAKLSSADALAEFFTALRYRTDARKPLSPEAIGLAGDAAAPIRDIEVLAEDEEGFMRVVFVRIRSLTAKSRNDLVRVLGRTNVDHLLVMTSDFGSIEFVLLDKRRRENRGPTGGQRIQVVPLVFAVDRKGIGTKELRTLRRFTWTSRDGLEQFDKLRSVFEAAAFTEDYFCNRALFADAAATVGGAMLGTSTVTTYIESSTGVSEGGRTGLTAVVIALLFAVAVFFTPIAGSIPAIATAPALIIVGMLMIKAVTEVPWDDVTEAIPAFVTIIAIPLTFSIANGLALGFILYPLLKIATGRWREANPLVYLLAGLFILRYGYLQ